MKSDYNIQKFKNFIILTSNNEGQPTTINDSIKKFFIANKKKITEYAILSEFAYGTQIFRFTTKSISGAIGLSEKTVRTTIKELENSNLIYSFKFGTGQNTSVVYYVVNLSSIKISKHMALPLLCFYFREVKTNTLVNYNNKLYKDIKEEDLEIAIKYYLFYEKNILTEFKILPNTQTEIILSIYNRLLQKQPSIFTNSRTPSLEEIKAFFFEELPINYKENI